MTAKRTEPTQSLLQGGPYTHSSCTDIRALFVRLLNEAKQTKAQNVAPIRRKAK